jgi:hypothetical protein
MKIVKLVWEMWTRCLLPVPMISRVQRNESPLKGKVKFSKVFVNDCLQKFDVVVNISQRSGFFGRGNGERGHFIIFVKGELGLA